MSAAETVDEHFYRWLQLQVYTQGKHLSQVWLIYLLK